MITDLFETQSHLTKVSKMSAIFWKIEMNLDIFYYFSFSSSSCRWQTDKSFSFAKISFWNLVIRSSIKSSISFLIDRIPIEQLRNLILMFFYSTDRFFNFSFKITTFFKSWTKFSGLSIQSFKTCYQYNSCSLFSFKVL